MRNQGQGRCGSPGRLLLRRIERGAGAGDRTTHRGLLRMPATGGVAARAVADTGRLGNSGSIRGFRRAAVRADRAGTIGAVVETMDASHFRAGRSGGDVETGSFAGGRLRSVSSGAGGTDSRGFPTAAADARRAGGYRAGGQRFRRSGDSESPLGDVEYADAQIHRRERGGRRAVRLARAGAKERRAGSRAAGAEASQPASAESGARVGAVPENASGRATEGTGKASARASRAGGTAFAAPGQLASRAARKRAEAAGSFPESRAGAPRRGAAGDPESAESPARPAQTAVVE